MSHQQPWTRDQDMASGRPPNIAAHPRRRAAHDSVSLVKPASGIPHRLIADTTDLSREALKARRRRSGTSVRGNPPSSRDSPPTTQKQSSGESSNAERWFETSNNEVPKGATTFIDNDPPYFLPQSSSSQSSPDDPKNRAAQLQLISDPSLPYHVRRTHLGTENSGSEDFRSVIDDLTVQNKKLKKKLKKYEKLHDAHLANEKLFEVRVHDLPTNKKRELEEMLKKFAFSLGHSPEHGSSSTGYDINVPGVAKADSSMSSARFADSAYASASASGQNTAAPTGMDSVRRELKSSRARNHANIQSYLHDIPVGLLPRQPVAMTEKARKKMVVRRLEQVFAGKVSTPSGHQQPEQQEKVAQQAATDDRQASEASGQVTREEGHREAKMMHRDEGEAERTDAETNERETVQHLRLPEAGNAQSFGSSRSPDQRPTRPLDLDPNRAQVPSENIEYIRHLGFSPPDVESEEPQGDKHGWIYLNIIINMAQLHTINVTADFVKTAINDYSNKLELSPDGRKVRWKGGKTVTRNSSEASPDDRISEDSKGNVGLSKKSGRKRIKLGPQSSNSSEGLNIDDRKARDKFAYTPLFYRKDSESEYDSIPEQISSSTSPWAAQLAGDSSGLTSSGALTTSSRKRKDDGPIIFYNKARFCTDLSGERRIKQLQASNMSYNSLSTQPVGVLSEDQPSPPQSRHESRGPLSKIREAGEPMDVDDDSSSSSKSLKFSPKPTSLSRENSSEDKNGQFEVSGLGGVYPEDNFTIDVKCQQLNLSDDEIADTTHAPKTYLSKLREILDSEPRQLKGKKLSHSGFKSKIVSTQHHNLPASSLPPPACIYLPYESDDDSDDSESPSVASHVSLSSSTGREVAPQPLNHFASESSGSETDASDDDSDDDGSLDFLAAAREEDAEAVSRAEREYDANMGDRFVEEIPAGSSAATAGGGSGFNSPMSMRVADSDQGGERMRPPKTRKRSRTVEDVAMKDISSGHEN